MGENHGLDTDNSRTKQPTPPTTRIPRETLAQCAAYHLRQLVERGLVTKATR